MTNIQQPEMRRSEHDPLVTDSVKDRARQAVPAGSGQPADRRPTEQRSPYGPQREHGRQPEPEDRSQQPEDRSEEPGNPARRADSA